MRRLTTLVVCILTFAYTYGQNQSNSDNNQIKGRDFELSMPTDARVASDFNKIKLLDMRRDTTNFGIVQVGAFNSKRTLEPKTPFNVQLNNYLQAVADADLGQNALILVLRELRFSELTKTFSERGSCAINCSLYGQVDSIHYKEIATLDTVVTHKSADVTKALTKTGTETLENFIKANLKPTYNTTYSYTYNDVLNIDSIKESRIPLYMGGITRCDNTDSHLDADL